MRESVERMFGQAAIGRDLAAVNGQKRCRAIAFVESQDIVAGYVLRKSGLVRPETTKDLNQIVFYLTLPPLIFLALHRTQLAWQMLAMPLIAWVVTLTGYKFTGAWQTALVVVGFTHGCVFTLYLFLVLLVRARMRWSLLTTGSILVAGLIPGGGYVVEAWALSGARVAALADVL